jgi:hypothetical protein
LDSFAEALKGRSAEQADEKPGRCRDGVGGTTMLKGFCMIIAKIGGILIPTLVGGIFFFAIIGVFGIWIAIAGLLMAVIIALITVSLVPAEGDAR